MEKIVALIKQCLDREYSVEIVKCGRYAKPDCPFLCRVHCGYGSAAREHLVYGNDASVMMKESMEHVLNHGFTQEQDRYGLRRE